MNVGVRIGNRDGDDDDDALALSAPPLALWSADRALANAAACCLPANDPLREAVLLAEHCGQSIAPVLAAAGAVAPGALLACVPSASEVAWGGVSALPGGSAAAAAGAPAGVQSLHGTAQAAMLDAEAALRTSEVEMFASGSPAGARSARLHALRAAVRARTSAMQQAVLVAERRGLAATDAAASTNGAAFNEGLDGGALTLTGPGVRPVASEDAAFDVFD